MQALFLQDFSCQSAARDLFKKGTPASAGTETGVGAARSSAPHGCL